MIEGTKLGRYQIKQKIGSGGMGEVFLARDSELDRDVALKVLPAEFCDDADRMSRFKQEARAASALNHPNIITIYEIGEAEGRAFIATEYIKGETLREKIERGDLTLLDSIKIAEQIASALATAHESHIVHRDIKPENIMIRRDGYAKILDFGLAKPMFLHTSGAEDATMKLVKTTPGMVMGSVRYMSPEQARGKEMNAQTDIWSLGVVFYEMVTGKNPFSGETVSDSLAAVIHKEPDFEKDLPFELQHIIRKCLQKNISERYANTEDLVADLKELRSHIEYNSSGNLHISGIGIHTSSANRQITDENKTAIQQTFSAKELTDERAANLNATQSTLPAPAAKRNYLTLAVLGTLALITVSALGIWYFKPFSSKNTLPLFDSVQVTRLTENGKATQPTISSDGKYVVYFNEENGMHNLLVRQVATGSTVQVVAPTNLGYYQPAFSPDGNYIYYTLTENGLGKLYQIPTLGGSPKQIAADVDSKVSFSSDGKRLAFIRHSSEAGGDTIYVANSDGTNLQPLVGTKEINYISFLSLDWSSVQDKILIGASNTSIEGTSIGVKMLLISLKDKSLEEFGKETLIDASSFYWNKNGTGAYFIAKATSQEPKQIWFISYPNGEKKQITNDASGYSDMSLAIDADSMVASRRDVISSIWSINPQTKESNQIISESRLNSGKDGIVQLSSGKIIYTKVEGRFENICLMDENGSNEIKLTSDGGVNIQPFVSIDEKHIVFISDRSGIFQVWQMDIDGKNPQQLTNFDNGVSFSPQILKDNKTVVFQRNAADRGQQKLMKIPIGGGQPERLFPDSQTSETGLQISPDGKYFSYFTSRFDQEKLKSYSTLKIYDFSGNDFKELKQIENPFCCAYKWSKDNKTLAFIDLQGTPNVFSFTIDSASAKQLTNFNSGLILNFNWATDGKRFFIVRGIANNDVILIKDSGKPTQS